MGHRQRLCPHKPRVEIPRGDKLNRTIFFRNITQLVLNITLCVIYMEANVLCKGLCSLNIDAFCFTHGCLRHKQSPLRVLHELMFLTQRPKHSKQRPMLIMFLALSFPFFLNYGKLFLSKTHIFFSYTLFNCKRMFIYFSGLQPVKITFVNPNAYFRLL